MSQQQADDQSGFIMYLSRQSLPVRLTAFVVFVILIVGVIVSITGGLYYANVANFPRLIPVAVLESASAVEFATFNDEEAYPAAVASAEDGTLYTGSYVQGTVWRINPSGTIAEIPGTREQIGSVIGLDIAADGTLYILDHLDYQSTSGAKVWQLSPAGDLTLIYDTATGAIPVTRPNDIAVDAAGTVYLVDIAERQILSITGDDVQIWRQSPEDAATIITGIAYHPQNNSLILTDAGTSSIYEIPVTTTDPQNDAETRFTLVDGEIELPFFNGVDVASDGTIYVAALDANEIWRIDGAEAYSIVAGNYRGSSDVAYDAANDRLYINNWDQSWLVPITLVVIQVDIAPRLPFSVDIINLSNTE